MVAHHRVLVEYLTYLLLFRLINVEGFVRSSSLPFRSSWSRRHTTTPRTTLASSVVLQAIHAGLFGDVSDELRPVLEAALVQEGWSVGEKDVRKMDVLYRWNRDSGMLQLVDYVTDRLSSSPPRWITIPKKEDIELQKLPNTWSLPDSDQGSSSGSYIEVLDASSSSPPPSLVSEPTMFGVDVPYREDLYRPKWGEEDEYHQRNNKRSALGYSLAPMTFLEVIRQAKKLKSDLAVQVLLQGKTEPPERKMTNNGFSLSGSTRRVPDGIFFCCMSDMPVFATSDLAPLTTSGWLSFTRPISPDHVIVVDTEDSRDPRMEVLCARSKCHLGYYAGNEGYCINACVLDLKETSMTAPPSYGSSPSKSKDAWKEPYSIELTQAPVGADTTNLPIHQSESVSEEGLYRPKWGDDRMIQHKDKVKRSALGYSLTPMSFEEVVNRGKALNSDLTVQVLLQGKNDPPGTKQSYNGFNLNGPVRDVPDGIFACCLSGLPLFSSSDLSPLTASSGWLIFVRPLSPDHVLVVEPDDVNRDSRKEVLCAKSKCHLGYYLPKEGYCINASVLNFLPVEQAAQAEELISSLVSYRSLESFEKSASSGQSVQVLRDFVTSRTPTKQIVLGCGSFKDTEGALRRLPGVVRTICGYTGGTTASPTDEQVWSGTTGHAEAVLVEFDPTVLEPRVLLDCFLSFHDPSTARARGKQTPVTGQYRSLICLSNKDMELSSSVLLALDACKTKLGGGEISTAVYDVDSSANALFWPAEEQHQHGSEELTTLSIPEWLDVYARRL